VQSLATHSEHVNGWRLIMNSTVLDHRDAEDITQAARAAALTA
jgi:hypothetical protein